jgi:predicted patatin/cPLA2 family phospholipase
MQLFREVASSKGIIDYRRFLRGGHLMDLDSLYTMLLRGDPVFNDDTELTRPLIIATTDVNSGKAFYYQTRGDDLMDALKASMALPLLYRKFPLFHGRPMTDGGIADGIPVAEAIRRGAVKIMVVRSRHASYVKTDTLWHRMIRWKLRERTELVATMRQRVRMHEENKVLIANPPPGISIVDISPPEDLSLPRFSRDLARLEEGYRLGFEMASTAIEAWEKTA